jgi:predicted DNA-binding transcriptional regulator AlpA
MATAVAAAYVGISKSSLAHGRIYGRRKNRIPPPPFIKIGRSVKYLKEDLDNWLLQHRVEHTSAADKYLPLRKREKCK